MRNLWGYGKVGQLEGCYLSGDVAMHKKFICVYVYGQGGIWLVNYYLAEAQ